MGFLDNLFGGGHAEDAARNNMRLLGKFETKGNKFIDEGDARATGNLTEAKDLWSGLSDMSLENLGFYKDALGLGGEAGNAATMERFQSGPGFQFAMDRGLDALDRRAAARGQLNSGNTNIDTLNFSQGLANQEFGGWLDRLGGFNAQQNQNFVTGIGGQAGSLGDLATLSGNTTDRRLNLGGEVLSGRMGANNQIAEAKNAGLSNLGSVFSGGMKLLGGYL